MNIARASLYSTAATAARLLAALVVVKLVASFAGPEGIGKLGQFMSLMSLLAVLAGGGISAGLVKYVAEYREDPARLSRLLASALWYALCASCLIGCLALLCSRPLALWLLDDARYQGLIRTLAVAQLGIALVNYLLSVINGFMDVQRLALVQVTGSAISITVALVLSAWLHLYGALLALILGQVLWLAIGLPAFRRSPYFRPGMWKARFDREMTARLAAFSIMTLSSAVLSPLVNIAVRQHLAAQFGWTEVGYWQAVTRVSDAYLLFLTAAINIYYLPKLAATHERDALAHELFQGWRFLMPVVVALALAVWLGRGWITRFLFTSDFALANTLYGPQLIGDVIKIASFVPSYVMLAKAMTRLFVASECVFALGYLVLVHLLTARFGLVGAVYAFSANYALYLGFTLVVARRYLERL
ncbi:O-antigen translocase [Frateuria sp. GZRe14]|uniref:O-antigen translocase n=1 Tax=Frateuria sp. GZRe14 TaxID=3351534 RepID=UPI003EDC7994